MRDIKSKYQHSLTRQKILGAACGVFEAVLGVVLVTLSIFCCFIMDYSANWREVIVPVIAVPFFGAATFMSVRDTMRRWREISRLQEFLGAMPEDELQKFGAAIGQSDFELYTDATGKTHFRTVDYEVHEES